MNERVHDNALDISKLKSFAIDNLPVGSPLREILLGENNEMTVDVFLARLPLYLRLSKLQNCWRNQT
jgi:hypothetical protein